MGHKKLVLTNPSEKYPQFLKTAAKTGPQDDLHDKPVLVKMSDKDSLKQLESLIKASPSLEIIDNYDEQYAELLLSKNAHLYRAKYEVQVASIDKLLTEHYAKKQPWELGTWVHFPWKNQLVHILAQEDFEDLRTIRNRDLITPKEQKKLFEFEAVAFGMSVGSAGALALGISGISRRLKLVDGAVISGSNLNRILTGVSSVGKSKALVIARQIYEMNPYSTIANYDKVDSSNIGEIFETPWPVQIAIDEIDDIEMKINIRIEARKRKIPVIMATELGDTIMLDVERFDQEPNRPLFHNLIPGIEKLSEQKLENYREWTKHAVNIIDPQNMPLRMQEALLKIGTTIVTHPQLGSTVMMTGGVLAFAAKNIALGNPLKSGRYVISLETELLADHQTRHYRKAHKKHTKVIHRAVNSM
ncbi:MAG: ThiF family adenylyltransferase [Candidatus Saccharimonadales bacterium]